MPPFLMPFGRDLIFDVIFGRKSIFVYFDRTAFAEFVTEAAAGKFVLKPGGQADHEWAGLQITDRRQEGAARRFDDRVGPHIPDAHRISRSGALPKDAPNCPLTAHDVPIVLAPGTGHVLAGMTRLSNQRPSRL
jgi:hypothetical protein